MGLSTLCIGYNKNASILKSCLSSKINHLSYLPLCFLYLCCLSFYSLSLFSLSLSSLSSFLCLHWYIFGYRLWYINIRVGVGAKAGWKWKWQDAVEKRVFWCISLTNNVKSMKSLQGPNSKILQLWWLRWLRELCAEKGSFQQKLFTNILSLQELLSELTMMMMMIMMMFCTWEDSNVP